MHYNSFIISLSEYFCKCFFAELSLFSAFFYISWYVITQKPHTASAVCGPNPPRHYDGTEFLTKHIEICTACIYNIGDISCLVISVELIVAVAFGIRLQLL